MIINLKNVVVLLFWYKMDKRRIKQSMIFYFFFYCFATLCPLYPWTVLSNICGLTKHSSSAGTRWRFITSHCLFSQPTVRSPSRSWPLSLVAMPWSNAARTIRFLSAVTQRWASVFLCKSRFTMRRWLFFVRQTTQGSWSTWRLH